MADENIIDFGNIVTPKSWDDVTLGQFEELERYYANTEKQFDLREVLHIFTNRTIDEINEMPMEFIDRIMEEMSFLTEKFNEQEPSNKIEIDGVTYMVNTFERMKTGEYVALDMALKNDKYDYSSMLAIICRKEGEKYDSRYESEDFEKRKAMFASTSVVKIMPIVNFFLRLWFVHSRHSQLFSVVEEGLDHIQQSINSSENIGVFRRLYLNWRMTRLRKSLKSKKNT